MTEPDFEALRAERNARTAEWLEKMRKEGWEISGACALSDPKACYCACGSGGPCEHKFDGEPYESEGLWTTTCSRCGITAFSHSMRNCP